MDRYMQAALEEARQGLAEGGIPIGSVLVHHGEIIGRGHKWRVQKGSTIFHGKMDALEQLDEPQCIELMKYFIADQPEHWNEDIGET